MGAGKREEVRQRKLRVVFWAEEGGVEQVAWGGTCFLRLGSGDTRGQAA